MRDLFEELLQTMERTAVDNKITITNVKLFVDSWREEKQMELEHQLFSLTNEDKKPPVFDLPDGDTDVEIEEGVTFSFPLILQTLEGHFVPQMMDMLSEYGLTLRVVKRDGIDLMVTKDVKNNRVNVETENGVITKVVGRG